MLSNLNKTQQIESLAKTTTTKAQIIKKIQDTPVEILRKMMPELPEHTDKALIVNTASDVLAGGPLIDLNKIVAEKIILPFGRPVYFIKDGQPVLVGEDIEKFQTLIRNGLANLKLGASIKSIGRIEVNNHPDYLWVGTGWALAKNLIVTNRHVAETFIDNSGARFSFRRFIDNTVTARIDFLAEYQNPRAAEFDIVDCLYIGAGKYEDIAILRIDQRNEVIEPLSILSGAPLKLREDVVVVGYPAYDSQTAMMSDMQRIFEGVYDYKRIAPGKVTQLYPAEGVVVHDATTLGGNSGSALISLETGKVIGLHFAGQERSGNFCLDAPSLMRIITGIPLGQLYALSSSAPAAAPPPVISFEANRNCRLTEYRKIKVPEFRVSGRIITYASPYSTFYITKKFFAQARESILIGIYDFTAEHVYSCVAEAIDRGVKVSLMLDLESEKETTMFKKLKRYGVECVPAPACTSSSAKYFSSSHEKVIIIDERWTMIQSGNYSDRSCPNNERDGDASHGFTNGNRDMGVIFESKPLARFFTKLLREDMSLQLSAAGLEGLDRSPLPNDFLVEAPKTIPDPLFSSKEFNPEEYPHSTGADTRQLYRRRLCMAEDSNKIYPH